MRSVTGIKETVDGGISALLRRMFVKRDPLWLQIRSGPKDAVFFCLAGREELGAVDCIKEPEYLHRVWVVADLGGVHRIQSSSFENHIGPGRDDLLLLTR